MKPPVAFGLRASVASLAAGQTWSPPHERGMEIIVKAGAHI
jgi:hypothetical protein